jgi:transposase
MLLISFCMSNHDAKAATSGKHSDDVFANGRAHVNGIENFWGVAKSRLLKLPGMQKKNSTYT